MAYSLRLKAIMKVAAIVPAAGKGRRFKSRLDKPYIKLRGRPILAHTLLRLSKNKYITQVIVAVNKNKLKKARREIINKYGIKKTSLVSGGGERKDSVRNALKNISCDIDYVLIHDGIRPFITDDLIESSLKAAQRFGASVVAVPVKPTLKRIDKKGRIVDTPDRKDFWEAQTPQVFKRNLIEKAYATSSPIPVAEFTPSKVEWLRYGAGRKINITDDSMLVELLGVKPKVVMGSYSNIKITTREDLELAKILSKKVA